MPSKDMGMGGKGKGSDDDRKGKSDDDKSDSFEHPLQRNWTCPTCTPILKECKMNTACAMQLTYLLKVTKDVDRTGMPTTTMAMPMPSMTVQPFSPDFQRMADQAMNWCSNNCAAGTLSYLQCIRTNCPGKKGEPFSFFENMGQCAPCARKRWLCFTNAKCMVSVRYVIYYGFLSEILKAFCAHVQCNPILKRYLNCLIGNECLKRLIKLAPDVQLGKGSGFCPACSKRFEKCINDDVCWSELNATMNDNKRSTFQPMSTVKPVNTRLGPQDLAEMITFCKEVFGKECPSSITNLTSCVFLNCLEDDVPDSCVRSLCSTQLRACTKSKQCENFMDIAGKVLRMRMVRNMIQSAYCSNMACSPLLIDAFTCTFSICPDCSDSSSDSSDKDSGSSGKNSPRPTFLSTRMGTRTTRTGTRMTPTGTRMKPTGTRIHNVRINNRADLCDDDDDSNDDKDIECPDSKGLLCWKSAKKTRTLLMESTAASRRGAPCFTLGQRCNGVKNCPQGEDEIGCQKQTRKPGKKFFVVRALLRMTLKCKQRCQLICDDVSWREAIVARVQKKLTGSSRFTVNCTLESVTRRRSLLQEKTVKVRLDVEIEVDNQEDLAKATAESKTLNTKDFEEYAAEDELVVTSIEVSNVEAEECSDSNSCKGYTSAGIMFNHSIFAILFLFLLQFA